MKGPIVVYGANGFIGRNLCLILSEFDSDVIAVSRSFDPIFKESLGENVDCVVADFFDTSALLKKIDFPSATHILLVSDSVASTWARTPSKEVSGNLLAHARFFEKKNSSDRIIYISSGGTVYGVQEKQTPISEECLDLKPICAYGLTKFAIEQYLALNARLRGFDYSIIRPANPVGPWSPTKKNQGIVNVTLERHMNGLPINIWGDGKTVRDYIDVRDVAQGIIAVASLSSLNGNVFNIGSGVGHSVTQILSTIENSLKISLALERKKMRSIDVPFNVLDSRKLTEVTGWRPQFNLSESIKDSWDYLSSHSNSQQIG